MPPGIPGVASRARYRFAPHPNDAARDPNLHKMISRLDPRAHALVRFAAVIAAGTEEMIRAQAQACSTGIEPAAVEELILQSYLFTGFPRTLNAMRAWRALNVAPNVAPPPTAEPPARDPALSEWRAQGERTCATVYGEAYDLLRSNIRALHPALDDWMIADGYGKVLSRPGLDLKTRELAIVAACAASRQQRQLHSHLHGALNAGASEAEVDATLRVLEGILPPHALENYRQLLRKVISSRAVAAD